MPHYHYAVTAMGSVDAPDIASATSAVLKDFTAPGNSQVVLRVEDLGNTVAAIGQPDVLAPPQQGHHEHN